MDLNAPERINDKAIEILQKRYDKVEPKFVKAVVAWIEKFRTSSGNLVRSKENISRLSTFKRAIERYLIQSGYNDMVSGFLSNFDTLAAEQQNIQSELNGLDITKSFLNPFKRWAVNNVVAAMQGQGLSTALINPLKQELLVAVNQGSSLTDVVTSIAGQLSTTEARQGVLKRISLQASRDALLQYDGVVNEAVRKSYKMDALLYVGSIVKDSRAQCERWVQETKNGKLGLLLFEDLQEEIDWADDNGTGMIPNTTPENFCQNRGGFNCRHIAYPVRSANYAKEEEAPKEPEAPKVSEEPKEVEAPKEPEQPKEIEAPKEPEQPKEIEAPKEVVKPKEVEQPKEPEAPKEVESNNYKKVKTVKEAKESVKSFMKENMGFKVNNVEYDENISINDINKLNANLNNLSKEYITVFDTQKSNPAFIFKRASNFEYGKIRYNEDGVLSTVFFGNGVSDEERISDFKFREKSKVDKDKLLLATSTHEFAHLIGTDKVLNSGKIKFYKTFWGNTRTIYKQYQDELLTNFDEVYLGRYANTNVNEFMAEAFTEYKLSSNPSKYALLMGQRIDKVFKK